MGLPALRASNRTSEVALPAATARPLVASARGGSRWHVEAAPFGFRGAVDPADLHRVSA